MNSEIDRICQKCEGLIVVATSDDDDLCVGCACTSDTDYKNSMNAVPVSSSVTAALSKERDPDDWDRH